MDPLLSKFNNMSCFILICMLAVSNVASQEVEYDTSKSELDVYRDDSEVYIEGEVPKPRDAELAEDVYRSKTGPNIDIEEDIRTPKISAPTPVLVPEPREDPEISEVASEIAINLKLLVDQTVSGATVSAEVIEDKVVLEGTVETEIEKKLLEDKVLEETGLQVVNNLEVGVGKTLNEKAMEILNKLKMLVPISLLLGIAFIIVLILANKVRQHRLRNKIK